MDIPTFQGGRTDGRPALAAAPLRALPEQIADELGARIVEARIAPGMRLTEQNVAEDFGVSRAPAREALRLLERRGLIDILPRRGAYVKPVTADSVVELFNIRIALAGYAARGMAAAPVPSYLASLQRRLAEMQAMARQPEADAREFARAFTRAIGSIAKGSGNTALAALMRDVANHTAWTMVWRHALDFTTPARRGEVCAHLAAAVRAIESGDGDSAEPLLRHALEDARDVALGTLARMRGERLDPQRLIHTRAAGQPRPHDNKTEETTHELAGRDRRP